MLSDLIVEEAHLMVFEYLRKGAMTFAMGCRVGSPPRKGYLMPIQKDQPPPDPNCSEIFRPEKVSAWRVRKLAAAAGDDRRPASFAHRARRCLRRERCVAGFNSAACEKI